MAAQTSYGTNTNNGPSGPGGHGGTPSTTHNMQAAPFQVDPATLAQHFAGMGFGAASSGFPTGHHGQPMQAAPMQIAPGMPYVMMHEGANNTMAFPGPYHHQSGVTGATAMPAQVGQPAGHHHHHQAGEVFMVPGGYASVPAGWWTAMQNTAAAAEVGGGGSFVEPSSPSALRMNNLTPLQVRRDAGKYAKQAFFSSSEVPGLVENRRSSYSTNESTPATPFYGSTASRDVGARVAIFDRSAYTTPSPQQLVAAQPKAIVMADDRDLDALLAKEPAIPTAVPAVFTPPENMKTLEQSLTNHITGNRNVYIRGLHPTTDDELLHTYAERFGPVETSKAIIDTATGACKGFGFAKFVHVADSEACIRGFYKLGYEVGFARESFNSRLKAEGDESSTNLYISNLPKSLTELELVSLFQGHTILSSKILRDSMGNSRGVGFARFESRELCEEIIAKFHDAAVGKEKFQMQIRFADTPAQKELKRITAERRQFRTNEYNVGAFGTSLVGIQPNIYGQQQPWKRNAYSPGVPNHYSRPSSRQQLKDNSGGESGGSLPACLDSGKTTPSDDGSGDKGATIHVESPLVANGSTRSSPIKPKQDK